jgi:hypothetical protein
MSHVAQVEAEIKDLDALSKAATALGCELRLGQTEYKWYGQVMDDKVMPAGFTADEAGRCEHAIVVRGADSRTYEIGVVKRRDGKAGYTLLYDGWHGGYGLEHKVGRNAARLTQEYTAQVTMKSQSVRDLIRSGYKINRSTNANGDIILEATK